MAAQMVANAETGRLLGSGGSRHDTSRRHSLRDNEAAEGNDREETLRHGRRVSRQHRNR